MVKIPGLEINSNFKVSFGLTSVALTLNLMVSGLHKNLLESGATTVGAKLPVQQLEATVNGLQLLELDISIQRLLELGSLGLQALFPGFGQGTGLASPRNFTRMV